MTAPYTDRSSKSINLNGVAYAQVDVPFIPGLSYKITLQAQRNAGYTDIYNKPEMSVSTSSGRFSRRRSRISASS